MVDAYFSRLDHQMLLLRAFSGRPLAQGELRELLSARWETKLKAVINFTGDRAAEDLLSRLRQVKRRIRNPMAHGGVENDGGSLFFHLPGVGALPANLSRIKESIRFNFIPIDFVDHKGVCETFDAFDALIVDRLAQAQRFIDAGTDPSFDSETLAAYEEAIAAGPEAVEDYLETWSRGWVRHVNMDY